MSEAYLAANLPRSPEQPVASLSDIVLAISIFLRRRSKLIYICVLVGLAAGNVYMWGAAPIYTAGATLILDMRNVHFAEQRPMVSDNPIDSAFVESQVEVIKSRTVDLAVIQKLGLTQKTEFTKSTGGPLGDLFQSITKKLGRAEPLSDFELTERALRTFRNKLIVKRVGLSFIIEVGFSSQDPELAAAVANVVIDAYLEDQRNARVEATRRAIDWLQESIRGLREQATAADRAVAEFKSQNNIVNPGGRLIAEQQISELSTQLVSALGQKTEAKARLERIESILNTVSTADSKVDPTVADSLKSEIITRLRSQYLDIAAKEADWTQRYGADHSATGGLRDQMREIKNSMLAELRRIAETYKSDYQIASQREAEISEQLSQAITNSGGTNTAQVTLHELEGTAKTYRSLYDDFLHRHMETLQQQSFPLTEGRALSRASRPLRVSWPRASIVYAAFLALGAMMGILLALLLDFRVALNAMPAPPSDRLPLLGHSGASRSDEAGVAEH